MKTTSVWLYVTVPVFLLSVLLLIVTIRSLIRTMRRAVVAAVPLREEQTIALDRAGKYDLYVDGKMFSTAFGGLDYTMTDSNGTSVPLRRVWLRSGSSSFSRARRLVRQFRVTAAGQFTLRVRGIRPQQDPENRLVVSRPLRAIALGYVLAILALAFLTIGTLVGSILLVVLPRGPTTS